MNQTDSRIPNPVQAEAITLAANPDELKQLYSLYIENTEKLRIAFERLEQRFREIDPYNIYSSITDALITLDRDDSILTVNKAAQEIFEVSEQDSQNQPFLQVVPQCRLAFERYHNDKSSDNRSDISFTKANGDPVFLRGRFSPLLDRKGIEIGTTCLFADLSVERILEEKARRSDRLTALGELAAGVAHEMRNPLTTIRGYLQIMPGNIHDPEFLQEFSDNLIREIDRLTRLTDNLLNMAKPIAPELETRRLSEVVDEVALFLADRFEKHQVELHIDDDTESTFVSIDHDRIKQVFINLIVNALEAMKVGGTLSIRFQTRTERLSEETEPSLYSVASFQDSGPGIPANLIERLFDPFFTTKDHGTGLGLALSNRIIEEHQGFLRVESQLGQGACFQVMLPVVEA